MSEARPVHIYFVLDRSGSMTSIQSDVIGGLNRFVDEQKATPGKCRFTFVQFDNYDPHELIHDAVKIAEVPTFESGDFQPRGMTPLLDAEGWTINRAIDREKSRKAAGKKPESILFVTFTDGLENASREWTFEALSAAKKAAEEERQWAFTYLGVGHDAYGQSAAIGTHHAATQSFAATSKGVSASLAAASRATRHYRGAAAGGQSLASSALYDEPEPTTAEATS